MIIAKDDAKAVDESQYLNTLKKFLRKMGRGNDFLNLITYLIKHD